MYFSKIMDLRRTGDFEKAMRVAEEALVADPHNIWNKRAAGWVFYDQLKKFAHASSYTSFKKSLLRIKELHLSDEENVLFDSCAWQIGKMVFDLLRKDKAEHGALDDLFKIIKDFHFTKPSEAYSFLHKSFLKGYRNWNGYIEFADWWNFEFFRPEDYLEEVVNESKVMSTVERAYIAYSKQLLDGRAADSFGYNRIIDKEKIRAFLPLLIEITDKFPEYKYPPYFKAILLAKLGKEKEGFSAILPFARTKRNNYWLWDKLADFFPYHPDLRLACYSKALSLNSPSKFLVKTREKLARILIDKNFYNQAVQEINEAINTYKSNNWKVPNQLMLWSEKDWFREADVKMGKNIAFYSRYIAVAEELIFQDIPEKMIVVDFLSRGNKVVHFVEEHGAFGNFRYESSFGKIHEGDLLMVRFSERSRGLKYNVLTFRKPEESRESSLIKITEGKLRIIEGKGSGIIKKIFVPTPLISRHKLNNGDFIRLKAIQSFNKSKQKIGWKAVAIVD